MTLDGKSRSVDPASAPTPACFAQNTINISMSSSKGRRITEETNRKQDGTTITYRREVPVTDPASLDDTQHLSSFGFDQNSCMLCSKTNEQCEGLLMQCGICKRVSLFKQTEGVNGHNVSLTNNITKGILLLNKMLQR